jgi:hypothetical protein
MEPDASCKHGIMVLCNLLYISVTLNRVPTRAAQARIGSDSLDSRRHVNPSGRRGGGGTSFVPPGDKATVTHGSDHNMISLGLRCLGRKV